eukprot:13110917-Heterocapsa_arctica.AAC.1
MEEIGVRSKALMDDVWRSREKNDKVNAELNVKQTCADETPSRSRTYPQQRGHRSKATRTSA